MFSSQSVGSREFFAWPRVVHLLERPFGWGAAFDFVLDSQGIAKCETDSERPSRKPVDPQHAQ